ncbi:MAG TPA: energy transducer TonB [Pseudoxanthomonas sp.]|nr:energy transducer TonB [Pseudoxanthomonas sp.]
MKAKCILIVTMLTAFPATSIAAGNNIAKCEKHLDPTRTAVPKLPPRLHNEFEGNAVVAYVIGTDGRVRSPAIVSSKWRPIGRSSGQPKGYTEAVLAAIVQWRFEPRKYACRNRTPMEFKFEDKHAEP